MKNAHWILHCIALAFVIRSFFQGDIQIGYMQAIFWQLVAIYFKIKEHKQCQINQ